MPDHVSPEASASAGADGGVESMERSKTDISLPSIDALESFAPLDGSDASSSAANRDVYAMLKVDQVLDLCAQMHVELAFLANPKLTASQNTRSLLY